MSPLRPASVALLLIPLLAPLLEGCARYEYDLVQPPELARHIGKADEVVPVDPLEYRLRTVENRLVVHVINPTDEPVTLIGPQSYIVSPGGQSHPLRPQTIAPHTFIPLILPPLRPYYYYPTGPTWGFGFGVVGVGGHFHDHHDHHRGGGHRGRVYSSVAYYDPYFGDPYPYGPPYYMVEESDGAYWEWKGEGDVRVHLVFQRGTNARTFSDDFTFHRRKM
jgi:hypothetical protein